MSKTLADKVDEEKSSEESEGKSNRTKRTGIIVAAIIAAVALCVVVLIVVLVQTGRSNMLSGAQNYSLASAESASVDNTGKKVTYNGQTYQQNKNIVSICVIGTDKSLHEPEEGFNGQADVVMVVALDVETGEIECISIPRDSMVEVNRNYRGTDEFADTKLYQLTLAYSYGTTDEESSGLVCTAVSRILYNVPMDYYYTTSIDGVISLVDTIGGVTVEALETIPDTDIKKGKEVTLLGDDALQYLLYRDESQYGSALDRQARQQQFVSAFAAKLLERAAGDPGVIVDAVNSLAEYSTTNLGASELTFLASVVVDHGVNSIELTSLQGEPVHNDDNPWEQFVLDKDAVFQTVLDVYYTPVG